LAREPAFGLLSFQKTSIDETTVKLLDIEANPSRDRASGRDFTQAMVDQAYFSCRRSIFCHIAGGAL
jgi:hypothetical protein